MRKLMLIVSLFTVFACSEEEPIRNNYKVVQYFGSWTPISYQENGRQGDFLIFRCPTDQTLDSEILNQIVSGTLNITSYGDMDCENCSGFSGVFDWKTNCDGIDNRSGNWYTNDAGNTMTFSALYQADHDFIVDASKSTEGFLFLKYYRDKEKTKWVAIRYEQMT